MKTLRLHIIACLLGSLTLTMLAPSAHARTARSSTGTRSPSHRTGPRSPSHRSRS